MASIGLLSNEDPMENLTSTVPSIVHKSSASVDDGRHDAEAHAEFLKVLKRRSLPHLPKRSSSLTLPPATPPADSPPSSPVEAPLSRVEWQLWLREFLDGGRSTPPPAMNEDILPDDWEGFRSLDGNIDAITPKKENWSNNSDASQMDPLPTEKPPSARYYTMLVDLWRCRPRLKLPATAHPVVHAFRSTRGMFEAGELPLDVGCNILEGKTQPSQVARAQEGEFNIFDEADNPIPHPNRSFEVSVIDAVDPNTVDLELDSGTIGVPPSSPRPAFRQIASSTNNVRHDPHPSPRLAFPRIASAANRVLSSFQKLNESIPLSQAQQIVDAALLLNFRMGRTLNDLASAAVAASPLGRGEPDGQENATSAYATVDTAEVVGDGRLIIDDAVGDSSQENMATSVQRHSLERVQVQNGSAAQVVNSSEVVRDGSSSSRMSSTDTSRTESEDANDWEGEEVFAPLQRARSRRPSHRHL